nr:hypothetical protein [Polaromonas sp. C04]
MRFMIIVRATRDSEAEDFGAEFTPELREQEARLRTQNAARP